MLNVFGRNPGIPIAAILIAMAAPAEADSTVHVDMGPYVPFVDANSAIVRAGTTSAVSVALSYRAAGGAPVSMPPSPTGTFHTFRVQGLAPATSYAYELRAGDALPVGGRWTTAPSSSSRPWSFVVYGDCRSDDQAHAAVVRTILDTPSDFLLQTGDLVVRGDDQAGWRRFFSIEHDLLRDRPVFVTVGNHDLTGRFVPTRKDFLQLFGPPSGRAYYSFRWANARFYVLDAMASFTGDQGAWIRKALETNHDEAGIEHRILALHHSPYSSGPHGPNERLIDAGLVDVFREHGVEIIFAGHDHLYERGEVDGLKYVISGGAGAPLYETQEVQRGSQRRSSVHHMVLVSIEGANVNLTTKDASGRVIERCGYSGGGPWKCDPGAADEPYRSAPPGDVGSGRKRVRCGCGIPTGAGRSPEWLLLPAIWLIRRNRTRRGRAAS